VLQARLPAVAWKQWFGNALISIHIFGVAVGTDFLLDTMQFAFQFRHGITIGRIVIHVVKLARVALQIKQFLPPYVFCGRAILMRRGMPGRFFPCQVKRGGIFQGKTTPVLRPDIMCRIEYSKTVSLFFYGSNFLKRKVIEPICPFAPAYSHIPFSGNRVIGKAEMMIPHLDLNAVLFHGYNNFIFYVR